MLFLCLQVLQYLQKAHRCVMQTSNWEKDLEKCQDISQQASQLADSKLSRVRTDLEKSLHLTLVLENS